MVDEAPSTVELRERARLDASLVLEEFWADGRLPVDPIEIVNRWVSY